MNTESGSATMSERGKIKNKTLEALEKIKHWPGMVLEKMNEGFAIIDEETKFVMVNDAFCRNIGYTENEIIGHKPSDFLDENSRDILKREFTARKHGSSQSYEVCWIKKDGCRLYTVISPQPIIDENGEFRGSFAVTTDISRVKIADENLRESEERFRKLSEASMEGIAIHDNGQILDCNERLAEILGYHREQMLNMHARELHDPENLRKIIANINANGCGIIELEMIKSDGSVIPVEVCGRPVRYRGKDVRVTSVRDISDRKKAEAAVRESEKRLRTVFETAKDSIFMKDIAHRYTLVNPAMEKMFGMHSCDIIGKTDSDIFGPEIGKDIHDTEIRVLESEIIEKERTLPINGIPYTFSIIKVPMRNDDELVTGLFGIARDLTFRKAAEEVIKKKNEELASALTVKTEFLSVVSHELRTPLVPILGYTELMLDGSFGDLPDYLKEPLQTVYDRADNLRKLIDDLLLVSRTDQRAIRIKLENISADRLIKDIIDSLRKVNQGKRVNFIWEGRECRILADPDRLRQVLQNLIENSIKYSEESVDITIETFTDGEFGHIKIADNGIGISQENLTHIFERFYQVENPDTRHHDGAGLGLSIVKELVELMNGRIYTESVSGKGSCFTISLPASNPDPNS